MSPYNGRAASGEIYDMELMTAAHRTLAFGTRPEVSDLDNGKQVRFASPIAVRSSKDASSISHLPPREKSKWLVRASRMFD